MLTTILSHLKGVWTLSVWEDLTLCGFLDITDGEKWLVGEKMGSKAQLCYNLIHTKINCHKEVQVYSQCIMFTDFMVT